MGYRMNMIPHHHHNRTMQDTATPGKVYAHNGTTVELAIPCWYQEVHMPVKVRPHNRKRHDHFGWPDPDNKDRSCQLYEPFEVGYRFEPPHTLMGGHPPVLKYVDLARLKPIHLTSDYEGYSSARIAWVDQPSGITTQVSIDDLQDWIVRVNFDINDPNAIEEVRKYKFTVFVDANARQIVNPVTHQAGRTQPAKSDIVCLGELIVLPSAF